MASPITVIKSRGIDTTGDYVVNSISSTGNVSAGNIRTDHLLYANGSAYAFTTNAAGTNTQVQFNDGNSFAGSANLTFNKTTGTLTADFFVGNGSQLTGLPASYTDTNANSAIDARVTKTFIDNLGVNANTLNGHSDTYFATSTQGALADTALQPSALTGYATELFVGNAVANLVNSAPAALDTLNELATALGNDASFTTTITNQLANKANTIDLSTVALTGNYADLNNKPTLFDGTYANLTGKPTLGTAAATDSTAYATAAQGTKADTALQAADFTSTADTWLGTKTTTDVTEGNNQYYTVTRANSAIDTRVTKTFIDDLSVVANISNIAYSVTGSNVSGQVSNALVAGTVYTNAQPNITSVGILTGLTVTGLLTATGTGVKTANIIDTSGTIAINTRYNNVPGAVGIANDLTAPGNITANYFIGDGSQLTGLPAGYTDSDAATYLPTYTGNLSPGNLVVSTSANLGNVANLTITGGTNGQLLMTDGNGVLTWSTPATSGTTVSLDSFTGDGANTDFTLSVSPANVNMITVNYNGSVLLKDSYSITGNVLTLGSAPFNGSKLEVISITNLAGSGGSGSSGPSYTYTEVSANTTMVASTKYIVDTSVANITLTLPASGSLGDEISVIDGTGNASSHAITIDRNGGNIQGEASDMTVTTDRAAFTLAYYNATQGWLLTNV